MGIDSIKNELQNDGFIIENDRSNYMVSFPKEKAPIWEDFIAKHLEIDYWNEYIADNCVVFLFHLQDGIKKFEVNNFENEEVLVLCEKLCDCKFKSIKSMLMGNHFYKEKLNYFI
jgi:hypothetical protein